MMKSSINDLNKPIAVFDAGIGSYSIVTLLKKEFPEQDIIYLADRNQFPYGYKSKDDLKKVIRSTLTYLENWSPSLIVVASNAPSITVLDDVKDEYETEILGVYPPIKEAIEKSASKNIGVLGVQSLIESDEMLQYIEQEATSDATVQTYNASTLVELVESGAFLSDKYRTLITVKRFMDNIIEQDETIDVFTLSSTHLSWLYSYLKELYPHIQFIDSANEIINKANIYTSKGTGMIKALVTTNEKYTLQEFKKMLQNFNVQLNLEEIEI